MNRSNLDTQSRGEIQTPSGQLFYKPSCVSHYVDSPREQCVDSLIVQFQASFKPGDSVGGCL